MEQNNINNLSLYEATAYFQHEIDVLADILTPPDSIWGKIKAVRNTLNFSKNESGKHSSKKKPSLINSLYFANSPGIDYGRCYLKNIGMDNKGTVRGSLRYKMHGGISMDAPTPLHMVDEAVNLFKAGGTPLFRKNSYKELCSFRITLDQRARLLRINNRLPATD